MTTFVYHHSDAAAAAANAPVIEDLLRNGLSIKGNRPFNGMFTVESAVATGNLVIVTVTGNVQPLQLVNNVENRPSRSDSAAGGSVINVGGSMGAATLASSSGRRCWRRCSSRSCPMMWSSWSGELCTASWPAAERSVRNAHSEGLTGVRRFVLFVFGYQ